jgi:DNA-binding CsgD family transcriptional regulator
MGADGEFKLGTGLRRAVGEVLFERFDQGLLVTDAAGAIVESNAAARQMLDQADGLLVRDGRLAAYRHGDTLRLRAALVELAGIAAHNRPGYRMRRCLLVARRGGSKPYSMLLWPEQLRAGALDAPVPCIFATIADLAERSVPDPSWLREAFGLTGREALLAAAITEGTGLASAAAQLGVGLATARSHLASVFLKTETRRQAELTRLVCGAAAPLRW